MTKPSRVIGFEEHFATPAYLNNPERASHAMGPAEALLDLGAGRLAAMDAAGVDVQVLSLTSPGAQMMDAGAAVPFARETNDYLAEAIKRHPDRFAGFATLPTADPAEAVKEFERAVKTCGFKGACINGHTLGRYLDDTFFWPILECAQKLNAPIYLHPALPPRAVVDSVYSGNFSQQVSMAFATAAWGWHIETAQHLIRLILSGAFDRFPKLQIMIGHFGEALPFMLPRMNRVLPMKATKLKREIGAYLRENVLYTFSGFNWTPAFLDLLLQVGADRILFSADYPYVPMPAACDFLRQMPVSSADREKIAHGNAERLLGM